MPKAGGIPQGGDEPEQNHSDPSSEARAQRRHLHRRHLHPAQIRRSSEVVGFAPFHGIAVCVSRSGRKRGEHSWVADPHGIEWCMFCDGRRE